MHLFFLCFLKKTSSSSPAGCWWTWSRGSVKPGTTSALSDGPQRKRREGEDEGFGRDGLTGWQEKDGDWSPCSLHTDNHTESSRCQRRLQCLYSPPIQRCELWIQASDDRVGRKQFWAPFKCFTIWCTYNIFICLLTVMGQSVFHASIFKLEG